MEDDMHNYKTVLCKQWIRLHKCSYFNKCMFAHGEHELLKPGEYNQRQIVEETRKKRYRRRTESSMNDKSMSDKSDKGIKSPLNSKAKEFTFRQPNSYSNNEYDHYWDIIHKMIISESEQIQKQKQKQLLPSPSPPSPPSPVLLQYPPSFTPFPPFQYGVRPYSSHHYSSHPPYPPNFYLFPPFPGNLPRFFHPYQYAYPSSSQIKN
jgi:hypothetical protein